MVETTQNSEGRPFGRVLLQAAIPVAMGAFFFYKGKPVAGGILCALGVFVLISGLFLPAVFARWERLGAWLGKVVGTALTWLTLVPMFYLVFFPGRLILLALGRDPMNRRFPTKASTYWVPRKPVGGAEEYRRQF